MSLSINTNAAALGTHDALAASNSALASSINKLSTGYRINSASDDPAGLVISENLRAQMSGLTQAVSNSQDGVNLVKTAEGALTQVNTLLNSMRSLAVHAANAGANSASSVAADQSQIASAIQSLNNISANTAFGNIKLLNGSGAQQGTVLKSTILSNVKVAASGSAFAGKSGSIDFTISQQATQATLVGDKTYASTGTVLGGTGGSIVINSTAIGTYSATDTVQSVMDDINAKSSITGVTAAWNTDHVELTQMNYGSDKTIALGDSNGLLNGAAAVTAGKDTQISAITVGGSDVFAATGDTAFTAGHGLQLKNAAGDVLDLTSALTGAQAGAASVAGSALSFQIGANAGETASISIGSTNAASLGVASIDVTVDASAAITTIDAAISQVATQRANLGAFQKNVLESNISSLKVTNQNVTASESAVRDTDMAAEMTNFTRLNIMSQAGIAMLTQANQQPQQLLSLLKG